MSESTEDLVKKWRDCVRFVENARERLREADRDLRAAVESLGKRLDPGDMQHGEQIAVWVRFDRKTEGLVVVTKDGANTHRVATRGERATEANGGGE